MATFRIQPHVRPAGVGRRGTGSSATRASTTSSSRRGSRRRVGHGVRPARRRRAAVRRAAAPSRTWRGPPCERLRRVPLGGQRGGVTNHGQMWGNAYSVCVSGIFVAPDSPYQRPRTSPASKVGVGYHSGSHYSAIQGARAVPGALRDRAALRRAAVRPRAAHARAQDPGGERVRRPSTTCSSSSASASSSTRRSSWASWSARTPTARTWSATSARCGAPSARSTSRRSATSTTGCASSPRICARPSTSGAFGPGRADRLRALHARDVRAHPPLDGELGAVRLGRGRTAGATRTRF